MPEMPIGRYKNTEAFSLLRVKQVAILQGRPVELVSSRDSMLPQRIPQGNRRTLIEHYAHSSGSPRSLRRVL